ncbi:conserved protein of unknown function [Tenacibaculum sp. 190524A02b]|uniref:hypothetical protein n=1 Tax=Tenacibaculum vairaonense TaxID=3137860 RepID=UPI0032B19BA3
MRDKFYFGMKVSLGGEIGVVIQGKGKLDWDKEAGIIRWDTNKEVDTEDWRGLYGSFIDSGGVEVSKDHQFKYIKDDGTMKN